MKTKTSLISILLLLIAVGNSQPVDSSVYERYAKKYASYNSDPNVPPEEKRSKQVQDNQKFVERFAQLMANMEPENIAIFELGAGERKAFVISLNSVPADIIAVYSTTGGENNKIAFSMYYPNGTMALHRSRKKEVVVPLHTIIGGDYVLEFINRNYFATESVNFGVKIEGQEKKKTKAPKTEQLEEMKPAKETLTAIEQGINDIFVQQKFFESRKSAQNDGCDFHYL